MAEHDLKTWPNAFDAIRDGRKRFEWRRDDRGFEVGDTLRLYRWDPETRPSLKLCETLTVRVTYILRGMFDVPSGFCIMSVEEVTP